MKDRDIYHVAEDHIERDALSWDGDNRWWIASFLIPNLDLSDADKAIMYETYGWPDGKSWEQESDGETLVRDWFLNGRIKNPAGVVHDTLNRVSGHQTANGHVWTCPETNALYRRIQRALGASLCLAWRRWAGLTISYWAGKLPFVPDWWR